VDAREPASVAAFTAGARTHGAQAITPGSDGRAVDRAPPGGASSLWFNFSEHVARMAEEGYTIVRGALTPDECAAAREAVLRLATAGVVLTHLFNRGEEFERVYTSVGGQFVRSLARHFLGDDATLADIAGSVQEPGGGRQGLHVDGSVTGPFQSLPAGDSGKIVSHMLSMRSIWPLSPFSAKAGSTIIVRQLTAVGDATVS
jgi:hypothetical protein